MVGSSFPPRSGTAGGGAMGSVRVSRRRLTGALAWTAPAVVVCGWAPAFAGSGTAACPMLDVVGGVDVEAVFTGLTPDGRWQAGAAGWMRLRVGRVAGSPGLGFVAGRDGLVAVVSDVSVAFSLPFWLSGWESVPTGWGVTPGGAVIVPGASEFVVVPPAVPASVAVATSAPGESGVGVVVPRSDWFVGRMGGSQFVVGQQISGGEYYAQATLAMTWQVVGSDCVTSPGALVSPLTLEIVVPGPGGAT